MVTMHQLPPKSQQHHAAPAASGANASEQATRWLLGRIKDGPQKALLLQQSPNIAKSLSWEASAHFQRSTAPQGPSRSYCKAKAPHQAPKPGRYGVCEGQPQLHNQSKMPKPHNPCLDCAINSSAALSSANNNHSTTAGTQKTESQAQRYPQVHPLAEGAALSGPPHALQGGFSLHSGAPQSSSASSNGIFNSAAQPKRPWEWHCLGKQPKDINGKQRRLVLRATLPIHWQQPQEQQGEQDQNQRGQQYQQHRHQHQTQLHRQHNQLQCQNMHLQQQHQQEDQMKHNHGHVHFQSPSVSSEKFVEPCQSNSCPNRALDPTNTIPDKLFLLDGNSNTSGSNSTGWCLDGSAHAASVPRHGAVVPNFPICPQPLKHHIATDNANPPCSWVSVPALDGGAPPLYREKPLKQQRCASEAPLGAASNCSILPNQNALYTAKAAARTVTKERGLDANSNISNPRPLLLQHGTLFGALSPEQTKVVNAPPQSSVCVLAGPGAGKTSTITARIVGLLLQGCRPLAALTFTKKSATELERRIRGGIEGVLKDQCASSFTSRANADVSRIGESDLFVGTFHSFFVRILKSYGGYIGVPGDFRVLNQLQQLSILRNLIDNEKRAEALRAGSSGAKGISAALRSSPEVPELSSEEDNACSEEEGEAQGLGFQSMDSTAFSSSTSKEAEELRKRIRSMKFIPELLERERMANSVLFRLFRLYDKHLRDQKPPLLDFTDLTVKVLKLLEGPATRAELGAQWPYLVVDEFQDTNSNQFKFICLLALQRPPNTQTTFSAGGAAALSNCAGRRGGVTVVGDDDQSIYKWRGTHTGIFHEFKRNFPDYQEFFLACNYRSVPAVVRHSLSLVSFNWPFRISKALYSSHDCPGFESPPCNYSPQGSANICVRGENPGSGVSGAGIRDNKGPAGGHVHGAFLPSHSLEAQYILRYILCLKQHHSLRWDDFAILCRTNSALLDIQNLLMNPRIQRAACSASSPFSTNSVNDNSESSRDNLGPGDPNRPIDPAVLFPAVDLADLELPAGGLPLSSTSSKRNGGAEIFLRPDVLDLLSYLRLAVDPDHDASFIRVLNRPPRRVGAKTLLALKRVQNASGNHSTSEPDNCRNIVEMPWQNVPWSRGNQRLPRETPLRVSLFHALCHVLRCAGIQGVQELFPVESAHADAVAAAEVARLRTNQVESLASFVKSINRLRSMSGSAVSVKALLEVLLGPLGMGEFFARRRLAQRSRRGELPDSGEAAGTADSVNPRQQDLGTPAAATPECSKPRHSKRKAAAADDIQPLGDIKGADIQKEGSIRELSKLYGSEVFADVLGFLRAVEAYSPNRQQATAGDCIIRLLRDADAGRFLQQSITNAITLSTIHQAKGLEWQVVIVARANEGTLPMGLGGSQPLADFVGRLISNFAEKPPKPEALRQAEATIVRQASGNEQHFHLMEERRVCYVALTRARRFLLLTAPLADKANHPLNPSRFFKEAGLVSQRQPQPPVPTVPTWANSKTDGYHIAEIP